MSLSSQRKSKTTIPTHLPREEMGALLGVTPTTISRLTSAGILRKEASGFPSAWNIQAYGRHVVDIERRRVTGSEAGRALANRKVAALAAQLDREAETLISTTEATDAINEIADAFASSFRDLGGHPELPATASALFEEEARRFREKTTEIRTRLITGNADDGEEAD